MENLLAYLSLGTCLALILVLMIAYCKFVLAICRRAALIDTAALLFTDRDRMPATGEVNTMILDEEHLDMYQPPNPISLNLRSRYITAPVIREDVYEIDDDDEGETSVTIV